jgi:hypothetical protein
MPSGYLNKYKNGHWSWQGMFELRWDNLSRGWETKKGELKAELNSSFFFLCFWVPLPTPCLESYCPSARL